MISKLISYCYLESPNVSYIMNIEAYIYSVCLRVRKPKSIDMTIFIWNLCWTFLTTIIYNKYNTVTLLSGGTLLEKNLYLLKTI